MSVFSQLFGHQQPTSREIAKERLQLVLVHDRVDLSPRILQLLKDDLITAISRYVEIDVDGVEVSLSQSKRQSRLVADIPVLGGRHRR